MFDLLSCIIIIDLIHGLRFRKLERYERDREREIERANQHDPELLRKLDDAETLIRRLRRENSELQREITNNSSSGGSYSSQRSTTSK